MTAFEGLLVPNLTPFTADLAPDAKAYVAHARWLLGNGADALAPFGTTGEANSLTVSEKRGLLDALLGADISGKKMMVGIGACAGPDAVEMGKASVAGGCGGVLLLPPFFYKGVSDNGIFNSIAQTIEGIGDASLKVYLYHIPPVAQVAYSIDLVGRLKDAFPDTVVGLKDSSGDWSNTQALLEAFPDFDVFPGSELFLLDGLRHGGKGCITATGNINSAAIRKVLDSFQVQDDASITDALQAKITTVRKTIQGFPVVPSLKAMAALVQGNDSWLHVRPPFEQIGAGQAAEMLDAVRAAELTLPNAMQTA